MNNSKLPEIFNLQSRIVVLTGAGISAESGIKTFRDQNGLWENHRIEDVATPEAFQRNPKLVHQFYNLRRAQLLETTLSPNAAHIALAKLESAWRESFLLVTQNVDNLHERAGSKNVIHMHGELQKSWCLHCGDKRVWIEPMSQESVCTNCGRSGGLRPDIVWFGEVPYQMDAIYEAVENCDLFISIGTSGLVYPAAGLSLAARKAYRVEVNLADTPVSDSFHQHRMGKASDEVNRLVTELLSLN